MTKTEQYLYDAVLHYNEMGHLAGNPCRHKVPANRRYGHDRPEYYRQTDLKAWQSLLAAGTVINVPSTGLGGGWAIPAHTQPGTVLGDRLNGALCRRKNELIEEIANKNAELTTIVKILGLYG